MNYVGRKEASSNGISNSRLKKVTTLAVCLSPVLCIYRVLGIFMFGEVILIALLFANILATTDFNMYINRQQSILYTFALEIFLISCIGYFANDLPITALPRLIRFLFCLFMAAIIGGEFFEYKAAKKYIILIACVSTALIIFQKAYHDLTGEFIYFLSKENIYSEIYNDAYFNNVETLSTYRPMSIFLEPSHYCQYILFALAIVLFKSKLSIKGTLLAAFFSVGIFISTSSTGVILCLALWGIYLFAMVKDGVINGGFSHKSFFIIALIVIVAITILSQFGDRFLFAIQRIYNPGSSSSTVAWDSRLGTFSIFSEFNRLTDLLFGRGYGVINEGEWYASIPYFYSGTGILGMLALVFFFLSMRLFSNRIQGKLLLVLFILSFTTEVLTNYWLIFILPLIMTAEEDKGMKYKKCDVRT